MRNILFILPNGSRLMRRNLRTKQVYAVGSIVKTSKGEMVVIKSNQDKPDEIAKAGFETVELRYNNKVINPYEGRPVAQCNSFEPSPKPPSG